MYSQDKDLATLETVAKQKTGLDFGVTRTLHHRGLLGVKESKTI